MSFFKKIPLAIKYALDNDVPFYKKLWIIFGLFYLFSPIDLIPEPVLGFGFIDDIVILGFIISKMNSELDKYKVNLARKKKEENIKEKIIENVDYDIKDE